MIMTVKINYDMVLLLLCFTAKAFITSDTFNKGALSESMTLRQLF